MRLVQRNWAWGAPPTKLLGCLCLLVLWALRADVIEQDAKSSEPSGLAAGVAVVDITPPVGIPHVNWGSQIHVLAEGVDPVGMRAAALVISDGNDRFAMVDIDTKHIIPELASVVDRASQLTGIPPEHIRLGATHTHAGVDLSGERGPAGVDLTEYKEIYENYLRARNDKIVGAIVEASSNLRPVHVYGAVGIGTININRRVRAQEGRPAAVGRNPDGFVDRDLPVIRMDDAQGNPYVIIANFQCHGTVLAYENKFLSPDWVGMTRHAVEKAMPGTVCLFFQGAAGNQGPIEGFTGDLRVAHRLGETLGYEVVATALQVDTVKRQPRFEGFVESTAYQAKQPWRVLGPRDGTLRLASKILELPPRKYTADDIAEMEASKTDSKRKLDALRESGSPLDIYQARARLRRFSDLLERWQQPYDPTPLTVRVQVLRIGETAIVSMPGEPFAEIGVAVKKASPFPVTLFCGYSNGPGGNYMPIESEYQRGGYEVHRTPYSPDAASIVISEITKLFAQVQ